MVRKMLVSCRDTTYCACVWQAGETPTELELSIPARSIELYINDYQRVTVSCYLNLQFDRTSWHKIKYWKLRCSINFKDPFYSKRWKANHFIHFPEVCYKLLHYIFLVSQEECSSWLWRPSAFKVKYIKYSSRWEGLETRIWVEFMIFFFPIKHQSRGKTLHVI